MRGVGGWVCKNHSQSWGRGKKKKKIFIEILLTSNIKKRTMEERHIEQESGDVHIMSLQTIQHSE